MRISKIIKKHLWNQDIFTNNPRFTNAPFLHLHYIKAKDIGIFLNFRKIN